MACAGVDAEVDSALVAPAQRSASIRILRICFFMVLVFCCSYFSSPAIPIPMVPETVANWVFAFVVVVVVCSVGIAS